MYYLIGTALALATLFAVNLILSLTASACWLCARRSISRLSAHRRARLLLALRFAPPIVAIITTLALVVPAYVIYEPRTSTEVVGVKLSLVALLSLCGICFAVWRLAATVQATRRLTAEWMRGAAPVRLLSNSLPAYRIGHPFPLIAVVGTFRPRLFIASQVFEALDETELAAAIAHETAHVSARDNLKHTLLGFARDLLLALPYARALDDAWGVESETAADERAAATGGASVALRLAGVLVKIARMAPTGVKPFMPAGSHIASDIGCIERRVRLLTQLASSEKTVPRPPSAAARLSKPLLAATLGIILLEMANPDVLTTTHALLEFLVHL